MIRIHNYSRHGSDVMSHAMRVWDPVSHHEPLYIYHADDIFIEAYFMHMKLIGCRDSLFSITPQQCNGKRVYG